ncbi:MAG: TonB-dependent receptor [Gammaproteobacteria bacterium]|nr:TonB-dependent receptor [Rhodocyclaceae bacterium]MBU3909310.1 TonB-dependent receptor [Gammaproteobacteria bacterium]MBU3989699.1 TonB-dependent receptor [Gammaproteobacteria bacterium]MBU4005530.1 TonB-dependent receptor [Gammaproteobacteria bacterium]MBU4020917.1 TonB-dependent receptor [Gammaproteobacteria bacterium]
MTIRLSRTAIAVALSIAFQPAFAAVEDEAAVVVTATRLPTLDVLAPYASEVHTRRMIEQSGAATLYDYLGQNTSVQVLPAFGNKATPKIDMRGYGIGDGYQNIVVTVDGRRLNNVDMVSQLIGSIPLADIERIEITKGSGSVLFGDGATAGTIQIVTRAHQGVSVQVAAGNFGSRNATVTAGLINEKVSLSVSADDARHDGYRAPDINGYQDASSNQTWRGGLELRPVDRLKLGLDLSSTRIDTRYGNRLTLAQFNADPKQNGGRGYTQQNFESDVWRAHAGLELNQSWNLTASHGKEDKLSKFSSGWKSNYDYLSDDVALQYRGEALDFTAGVQTFDGTRINATNHTRKDNTGWYALGQYRLGGTTLSAGVRAENVEYTYAPNAGAALKADHDLNAWDIGMNHRLDERLSLFANYNRGFQAPDIDRFFSSGAFNGFINPARSRTLNIGLNHVTPANRLKLTVFRAKLDNEIYYYNSGDFLTSYNTNIDKSRKYGLELQDTWRVAEPLSVSLNYAYTRAIIDRENDGGGAYNGKDLPGVPRHGVTLGLAYAIDKASSLNLSHAWRSTAYAANDFANTFTQKQAAYQSTDVAYRYRHNNVEWFAAVENLFERKNGLWIRDDAIYPVNFTRNWRFGMKAAF